MGSFHFSEARIGIFLKHVCGILSQVLFLDEGDVFYAFGMLNRRRQTMCT